MTVSESLTQREGMMSTRNLFTSKSSVDEALTLLHTQFPSLPCTVEADQQGLRLSVQRTDIDERTLQTLPHIAQALALQTHSVVTLALEDSTNTQLTSQDAYSQPSGEISLDTSEVSVVAQPMIRTVVLDHPFSDVYMDIPANMLADLYTDYTLGSLLHPNRAEYVAPSKEVTQVLSKYLKPLDFKVIKHTTFLQIVLRGDGDLVEEPAFFDLNKEIAESNRHDYPIVITIVPETKSAAPSQSSPTQTGSATPVVIATPQGRITDTVVTLATTSSYAEHHIESLSSLAETARALLRLKGECSWLDVQTTSTGLSIYSKTPLPKSARDTIERKLEVLPVPIDLVMPSRAKDSLGILDIKSIIKFTLPPTANLIRADIQAKEQLQKITVRIGVNPIELPGLSKELRVLQEAFKPVGQELTFKYECRTPGLSARLGCFHPRSLSTVFRQSKGSGAIIPVESFKYEERGLKLPETLTLLLHKYNHDHGARVFNDAPVLALDNVTAGKMREDAFSVKFDGNRVIFGIHVVNGAFLVGPTSFARFSSYGNGNSLYTTAGCVAPMLPGLRGAGLREDKACPTISMLVEVDAQLLTQPRGHTRGTALLSENVRFELTQVTLAAAETYSDGENGCTYLGKHRREVAALQQFARLIREQELSVKLGSGSLALDIHTLLSFFNNRIVQSLEGAFPLMYSSTGRVSKSELSCFLKEVSSQADRHHPIQELCKLDVETLASNDKLLHELIAQFWSLIPAERSNVWFPFTEQPPTTTPDSLHLSSGYQGYTPANKPLRDMAALVAQHQFNAHRGMYPPLSEDQVEVLCERASEQSALAPRLRRDLLLFHDLALLGARAVMGIEARLLNHPQPHLRIDSLADQARRFEVIEGQSKLADVARQTLGSRTITVWPLHYDVEKDIFVFTLKKPQRP